MDWTLLFSAFLSATLLPGSSEALLLLRLAEGTDSPLHLVLAATVGNLLGSLVTYAMGRAGNLVLHRRWLRISETDLRRAERWFGRWGTPVLLFAWLPLVGDPLCLLAGVLRVGPAAFIVLVGLGKLGRYAFIAWLAA